MLFGVWETVYRMSDNRMLIIYSIISIFGLSLPGH